MEKKPQQQQQRWLTPADVAKHNSEQSAWVSVFSRVVDVTSLLKRTATGAADVCDAATQTLLRNAGRDVSHWFDRATGDVRTVVDAASGLATAQQPLPHAPPAAPTTAAAVVFAEPWWRSADLCVGRLTQRPRRVGVLNTLLPHDAVVVVECAAEEPLSEVLCGRYAALANAHARSYTAKYLGRTLDPQRTLEENGVPDDEAAFEDAGVDGAPHVPTLFLYFNDDLTADDA